MTRAFDPKLLEGRVALITGGGTGICRGIALAFARHGCHLAITSRKMEHLAPTVDELNYASLPGQAGYTSAHTTDSFNWFR